MNFKNRKLYGIVFFIAVLIFISISVLLDMLLVNLLLLAAPILHLRHLFDSYEVNENDVVIKGIFSSSRVPLDTIEHVKRIYGFAEEDTDDRSATYLIAVGKNYRILNRFAKNKSGISIIDVLINEYQIPILNEKAIFIIKTRIKQ